MITYLRDEITDTARAFALGPDTPGKQELISFVTKRHGGSFEQGFYNMISILELDSPHPELDDAHRDLGEMMGYLDVDRDVPDLLVDAAWWSLIATWHVCDLTEIPDSDREWPEARETIAREYMAIGSAQGSAFYRLRKMLDDRQTPEDHPSWRAYQRLEAARRSQHHRALVAIRSMDLPADRPPWGDPMPHRDTWDGINAMSAVIADSRGEYRREDEQGFARTFRSVSAGGSYRDEPHSGWPIDEVRALGRFASLAVSLLKETEDVIRPPRWAFRNPTSLHWKDQAMEAYTSLIQMLDGLQVDERSMVYRATDHIIAEVAERVREAEDRMEFSRHLAGRRWGAY